MSGSGSVPEWQEIFRTEAKPPFRFRDSTGPLLMTAGGWLGEWRLRDLVGRDYRTFTGSLRYSGRSYVTLFSEVLSGRQVQPCLRKGFHQYIRETQEPLSEKTLTPKVRILNTLSVESQFPK